MASFTAGQIVTADWRADWRDALPKEPNKRRPAIVVEAEGLFAPVYSNVLLVPLSEDSDLAIPDLSLLILPTAENGCTKPCHALSHCITTTSVARLRATQGAITAQQLQTIRRHIAACIGMT